MSGPEIWTSSLNTSSGHRELHDDDALGRRVRGTLQKVLLNPAWLQKRQHEVRAELRTMCGVARVQQLPVERLLLVLKSAWRDLGAPRDATVDPEGTALDRIISLCIEEYYEPGRRG